VITTPHALFDYDEIVRRSPLIVDTRNALQGRTDPHIVRL
jgi:UDP-N-acetyl-D-mannosaminuronate dehydrogenase